MATVGSWASKGLGRATYIVFSETAATGPVFTVRGQASQGGRIDVIVSSIIAAKHDPLPGFVGVLMGPPSPVKLLHVKEWDLATPSQIVVEILAAFKGRSHRIEIRSGDPLDPIYECRSCKVLLLEEGGIDIAELGDSICGDVALLLGGHTGFPEAIYSEIAGVADARVSIAPVSLQTYQAILYLAWRRSKCGPSSRRE